MNAWVGWDLGGAHVKAALLRSGRIERVWQCPCSLWRGPEHLDGVLSAIAAQLPDSCFHGITMTGEMADCFPSREVGVRELLRRFAERLGGTIFVSIENDIIPLSEIDRTKTKQIASNNWRLPPLWLVRQIPDALFVDVGSTTTDLVSIGRYRLLSKGSDDHRRLARGELLYTGVVRTPLMALTQDVPFQGERLPLMAEHFATTADVYRVLGSLPSYADQAETADGGNRTVEASMQRLARMVGLDMEDASESSWRRLALAFRELQLQTLTLACLRLLRGSEILVGAGVGRFLLPEVARRLELPYRDFADFVPQSPNLGDFNSADCAPAAALALLMAQGVGDNDMMMFHLPAGRS